MGMNYIISAKNLGKLMRKAGMHVRETLEMTDGKTTLCRDCGYFGKDPDGDEWCSYLKRHVVPDDFCAWGWSR